ncbi:MAG: antiterminator Q family protein [Psychrobacter alimentarius]
MIDLNIEIQELLTAWGNWVLAEGNGLGYSSPMARLMRGHVLEKSKARAAMFLTDDEALKVERLVTILCECKPLDGEILKLKYIDRMSANGIAEHYLTPLKYGKDGINKVSSHTAVQHIARAEGFIAGLIVSQTRLSH